MYVYKRLKNFKMFSNEKKEVKCRISQVNIWFRCHRIAVHIRREGKWL
jgi:hypothetical protein